jgi:hypothetical protein
MLLRLFQMPRIRQLIDNLSDAPSEATAVALADAVFMLATSTEKRLAMCLEEADAILGRAAAADPAVHVAGLKRHVRFSNVLT